MPSEKSASPLSLSVEVSVDARPFSGSLSRLEGGASLVSHGDGGATDMLLRQVAEVPSEILQQGLVAVAQAVSGAMEKIAPDSATVEFSLGFKAGAKVPVLMSGEANSALKVTLSWKRAASTAGGRQT